MIFKPTSLVIRKVAFISLLFFSFNVSAQPFSDKTKNFLKKSALPAAFITAGLIVRGNAHRAGDLTIKEARDRAFPNFRTHADDYLQYAPLAAMLSLGLSNVKAERDWRNVIRITLKSELTMMALVLTLKVTTRVWRPDRSTRNSFPSGHTAQAFVAATVLHHEYGRRSIWYSIGGYTCATAIGAMRILNNRHWTSDVLAGAGIGILATEFIYATHRGTLPKSTMIIPSYSPLNGVQIDIVHHFK